MVDRRGAFEDGHHGTGVNEAMSPKRPEFTHRRAVAVHDEGSTVVQRTHDSSTIVAQLALGDLLGHLTIVALGATGDGFLWAALRKRIHDPHDRAHHGHSRPRTR